ncbi:hypothetical protein EPA93_35360 [Ktedonosporobacter rubrisoli]|uniref:Uncharacterized protein n=1 Tax=Ktedonosporobacter rubrisoli TaxID=2509675 RepID=A0A4P6K0N6_KTERU|nr:DUF6034 family protein [Ktedonosporobacter rubrisoli]QBD80966.1 hypothetical protein EPA93_35360 [Ktedonosporobacter rubrisoli]
MKQEALHKQMHEKLVWFRRGPGTKLLMLALLLTVSGSLAACQSTPTTPPVVGKQQNINTMVKNNIQNTNLLQGVPQTLLFKQTQGAVTLNVNGPVQLPQTSKIPVITTRPTCFSQDTVTKIINTLMPGKQLYAFNIDNWIKTNSQKLTTLLQALQMPGTQGNKEITTLPSLVPVGLELLSKSKADFSALEQKLGKANAPATEQGVPATGKFQRIDESDLQGQHGTLPGFHGNVLSVYADSGKGYDMILEANASDSATECDVSFASHGVTDLYNYTEQTGQARGMSISLDQAKALAQHTLQAVGASDLKLSQVQVGTAIPLSPSDNPNSMKQAYGMWFTRSVDGVPTTVDLADPDQNAYHPTYPYERLFMLINDAGVIEFSWKSPMQATGTISSNAQILPFQEAMNRAKEQFFIRYAQSDASKGKTTFTINRITLGMMRVQNKDQANTYTMIPVWDFYGTGGPPPSNPMLIDHSMDSFLTINAINGSAIDRTLGY